MGMTLIAAMALLLQTEELPRRSPTYEGLAWLVTHQRDDGSWGAPPLACVCRHVATPEPGDIHRLGAPRPGGCRLLGAFPGQDEGPRRRRRRPLGAGMADLKAGRRRRFR